MEQGGKTGSQKRHALEKKSWRLSVWVTNNHEGFYLHPFCAAKTWEEIPKSHQGGKRK